MGGGQTRTESQQRGEQRAEPTAEERELQGLQLERRRALQPFLLESDIAGFETFGRPLSRGQLPGGVFGDIGKGISEETQQRIIGESTEAANVSLAGTGLLDSGARAELGANIAKDVKVTSEFARINQLQNLLNLAIGAPAQLQQPALSETALLSQRLQGLRPRTQFGSGSGRSGFSPGFFDFFKVGAQAFCWVASEIFGGWFAPETVGARIYVDRLSPTWFKWLYCHFGERVAKFISNKPLLKWLLKPIFKHFSKQGWLWVKEVLRGA